MKYSLFQFFMCIINIAAAFLNMWIGNYWVAALCFFAAGFTFALGFVLAHNAYDDYMEAKDYFEK